MTSPHGLAINDKLLLASDAAYFSLAAEVVKLDGAHLFVNPKFTEIPAACVVTSVSKVVSDGPFSDWQSMVERSIRDYGFEVSAERWVAFERAKCQTGRMTAYLARDVSRAVGTFCILEHRGYLRLKNLLVHPEARRQGVGERIIREALRLARQMELEGIVAFAVSDGPGEHLYRSAKMTQGGQVIEWRKSGVD